MKISIFGLGYVGAVTAGCLARQGHGITGVDVHAGKVESFNQGIPPIVEPGLDVLLREAKAAGRLHATTSCAEAIAATELSIVCVGTSSAVSGALDLTFVREVVRQIVEAVQQAGKSHVLVMRSTMLPGSTGRLMAEFGGELVNRGQLKVFYFPEFLRESTAVKDFEQPSLAVVGSCDASRPPDELMLELFGAKANVVNWPTAELVKYACNAFHAAKITFANEIGRMGKALSVDARAVMDILCQDTRLNLSSYYMKPGNPFGGSCLPKDVRALMNSARMAGIELPMIESLLPSNERHLRALLGLIEAADQREVCILGLSFKANTDDLRESAMVEVAQTLLGRGHVLRIYDPALNLAALVGANKRVIDVKMPHLASLLQPDLATAVGRQGLIIAAQKCVPIAELAKVVTPQHQVLDVNGWSELTQLPSRYAGFCW